MTLKDLRLERGLTQAQCAEYSGVTRRQYINWESGYSHISPERLRRLAEFLKIDCVELFASLINEGNNGS